MGNSRISTTIDITEMTTAENLAKLYKRYQDMSEWASMEFCFWFKGQQEWQRYTDWIDKEVDVIHMAVKHIIVYQDWIKGKSYDAA